MSKTNSLIAPIDKAEVAKLDTVAAEALQTLGNSGSFEATFAVADAMMQLREAITPAMMTRFMGLQNSKLGFMTDKNPKVWNKRLNNGSGGFNEPYPENVVKDCVIEATLRGVKPIGNMFNIIAGGCYLTKEGFEYKLKQIKGFTDFKPSFEVPKVMPGGAIINCSATWKMNGNPDSITATIAAKGDDYAGTDSYIGKAQRKFYKRIYEIITGNTEPDGEVEQLSYTDAKALNAAPLKPLFTVEKKPTIEVPAQPEPTPDDGDLGPVKKAPINPLRAVRGLLKLSKQREGDLLEFLRTTGKVEESLSSLDEIAMVAPAALEWTNDNWSVVLNELKKVQS